MVKKEKRTDEMKSTVLDGVFQQRLEDLKAERKLTNKEIADKAGVKEGAVSYWINGIKAPDAESLIKLSKGLNVSVDYLLGLLPRDVNTTNLKARYISKQLGISTESVRFLRQTDGVLKQLLNKLLCSDAFMRRWLIHLQDVYERLNAARYVLETIDYNPDDIDSTEEAMKTVFEYHRNLRLSLFDLSEVTSAMVNALYSSQETILELEKKEREINMQYNSLYNSLYSGLSDDALDSILDK